MIEVPRSVAQEYILDKNNGNTLWSVAVTNDINDLIPDFNKLDNGEIVLILYHHVNCHMIFDVKMEDLRIKVRLVSGGHVTNTPFTITYASVMSR